MKMLASITDIRDQLGFDDMTDINDALTSAMVAATTWLQSKLNTRFDAGNQTDLFFMREASYIVGSSAQSEFRLRFGFIQSVSRIVTFQSPTDFDVATAYVDIAPVMQVHYEKGKLVDFTTRYANTYIRVDYAYGWAADGTDADLYDQSKVPDWLKEAARLKTLMSLNNYPSMQEANITLDPKTLGSQLHDLLSQHLRYMPASNLPIN